MGRRWTDKDVDDLKRLAEHYTAQYFAEMLDRSVSGVAFKAHQLRVSLRSRSGLDPGPAGFIWEELVTTATPTGAVAGQRALRGARRNPAGSGARPSSGGRTGA